MAHKKGSGRTKNGRDSQGKRLGIKSNHGSYVKVGQILLRQRGLEFLAGDNVALAKDYTLYALKQGRVEYKYTLNGKRKIQVNLKK